MASTTANPQTADSSKDKDVNVSSSSEEQTQPTTQEGSDDGVHSTEIKNNQQIRTGRSRSHMSDDEDDDDEDSNNGMGDEATSTTGPSNNGFHDESSGGSTSSGSRIPVYSGNNSGNLFNAQICSPSAPFQSTGASKSNPFLSAGTTSQQNRPILRPSSFKFSTNSPTQSNLIGNTTASPSSTASPAVVGSPFVLRPPKLIPTSSTTVTTSKPAAVQDESAQQTPTFVPLEKEAPATNEANQQPGLGAQESTSKKTESESADADNTSAASTATATSSASSFVFGSNLSDRVIPSDGVSSTSSGIKRKLGEDSDESEDVVKKPTVTVDDGSAQPQPLLPQQVITGEEDEINVLKIQCRLFIFDVPTSSWVERGRGSLRLNDSKDSQPTTSRLIIRTKGSLRVMLNTKVWEGMRVEKAGEKSIRIMAVDLDDENSSSNAGNSASTSDGGSSAPRIFLIMTTSLTDANTLASALESRVRKISQDEEAK